MAAEELDEFEVLWPEYYACYTQADDDHKPLPASVQSPRPRCAALSRPVDVPSRGAVLVIRWKDGTSDDLEDNSGGGGGKIIVPPHLLVSGRRGESTTAACTVLRSGRQHQHRRARDLRHLRNSVLRMTGFIEG